MRISFSDLFMDILAYDGDLHRTNHLIKVCGYAVTIGEQENMPPDALNMLQAAALLHDIGIKASLEKHGSSAPEYQQTEGPPIARELLQKQGYPDDTVERICYLIAHHHIYRDISGLDYQVLVEADFIVNSQEHSYTPQQIKAMRDNLFRTQAGIAILNQLFDLQKT